MTQKVLKVGSSAAVTIPKKSLEELGLRIGDPIKVEIDKTRKTMKISPVFEVNQELISWTDGFIKKYRPALEALAKK